MLARCEFRAVAIRFIDFYIDTAAVAVRVSKPGGGAHPAGW
ncbi:Uncharacterised protein [Mycobacteroides abscessus subsp. abscessus]|nr:Uncharacterised protein [Mycobacteroides abscessus subsp. abscessus]